MAVDFFAYKRAVVEGFAKQDYQTPMHDLNAADFYRLSFYNRGSAELEQRLLSMLMKVDSFSVQNKKQAKYYLEASARFLLRDAQIADNTAEAKKYVDQIAGFETERAQLATAPAQPRVEARSAESEWKQAFEAFKNDLQFWLAAPWYASRFITLLSYLNLYRLLAVFSRLSIKFFWKLAAEKQWIDAQDNLFGHPIQRSALELPVDILNVASVALFALRLLAHGLMILKHARSQREGEKDIPVWDRFWKEVSLRLINIMNDGAWVFINLFTNYAPLFHIADPIANLLLGIALVWDCVWLGIHWYREERDWNKTEKELQDWAATSESIDYSITQFQLQMLIDLRLEMRAKYLFMIAAGLSIMGSIFFFITGASALVTTCCLVTCVIGFAMYGSADEFGAWVRASWGSLKIAEEREKTQAKLFKAFTQAILPPFVVMGLLSFGWQAAFLGAVAATVYAYAPANWGWRSGLPPHDLDQEPPVVSAHVAEDERVGAGFGCTA